MDQRGSHSHPYPTVIRGVAHTGWLGLDHVSISIPQAGAFRSGRVVLPRESTAHEPQASQVVSGRHWSPDTRETETAAVLTSSASRNKAAHLPSAKKWQVLICISFYDHLHIICSTGCTKPWGADLRVSNLHPLGCKRIREAQYKKSPPVIGGRSSADPCGCSRSQRSSERKGSVKPGRLHGKDKI